MAVIVHRHTFTIADAVGALLPDIGDCEAWQIRVEGEIVVVDVIEPISGSRIPAELPDAPPAAIEQAPATEAVHPEPKPEPRKGGDIARKAGIVCGEKGFWTFLSLKYDADVGSSDAAATWVRQHCSIDSRADLDHDADAAAAFREVDRRYGLWLEGYD